MYPNMDTASNYSAGDPKKNSEAHKTSGEFLYVWSCFTKPMHEIIL